MKAPIFQQELINLSEKIKMFLNNLFEVYGKDLKIVWALGMLEINDHVQKVNDKAILEYNNPNVYQLAFNSLNKIDKKAWESLCKELQKIRQSGSLVQTHKKYRKYKNR